MCAAAATTAFGQSGYRVEIDLEQQRAYLLQGRHVMMVSPISSGRSGHLTQTGSFKVVEKEQNHHSSIYGKIVDRHGNTVVVDADADMKVPPGGKFIPAPMRYFMRFHGADGMHAGYLPGYPASHGCIRMPEQTAIAFFDAVPVGTPVTVFGRTPRTRDFANSSPGRFPLSFGGPRDPRFREETDEPIFEAPPVDPRYDPRRFDSRWR
ncbi:MAG: L,D-transpeptidase [Verrucomicrobiota bacterium]